nr:MAG TPA: hypothetical protein [Bacteriophage sp.]DAO71086.1 MAG TPA: hypothetical protein [Caudoviricetes sp.]
MGYRICFRSYISSVSLDKSCTCRNNRTAYLY